MKETKIIGRANTIKLFETYEQSKQAEFVAIHGRRRVGKTFLIREYFNENMIFDYTGAYEADTDIQLFNFYEELKRANNGISIGEKPGNWSEAFQYLVEFIHQFKKRKEKIIVFIDEMPWLDRPKSGFISALEYFWNQHGSKMNNLLFITCGSSASWILNNLIKAKGGLYNRITQSIELKPFTLQETELFVKSRNLKFTNYQIVQLYMALGGIPFYWNMISQGKSVSQVIDALMFQNNSPLQNEFGPLYHSLFRNAEYHIELVETLAQHIYGLTTNELADKTKIPKGGALSRTIKNLLESNFIIAMPAYGKKKRQTIYRLIDFYSHFYIRFIRNNKQSRPNTWQSLSSEQSYKTWTCYAYENIFLTHMPQVHEALGIQGIYTEISSWRWKADEVMSGAQVDIVIERPDGLIHLCEVKFTNKEFVLTPEETGKLRHRRTAFEYDTKTKKSLVTTLFSSYSAIPNANYLEEIYREVNMDKLFVPGE